MGGTREKEREVDCNPAGEGVRERKHQGGFLKKGPQK